MGIFALHSGLTPYSHPWVAGILALSVCTMIVSVAVRRKQKTATGYARQGLKTWATLLTVFAVMGVVLGVSRAEDIAFLSMPFLTILWGVLLVVSSTVHLSLLRSRSYTILPHAHVHDPREQYLPKKRRR